MADVPQVVIPAPCPKRHLAEAAVRWLRASVAWAFGGASAYIFELDDLAACAAGSIELPDGCDFREVGDRDLAACAAIAEVPVAEYRRRCSQGGRCYAVFWEGKPVHLAWLHFGSVYVRGLGLLIENDASVCYLYNVVTEPSQRRRGLYQAAQRRLAGILNAGGGARVVQVVMKSNTIPQQTLVKLGYRMTRIVRHRSFCGWRWTSVRDVQGNVLSRRLSRRTPTSVFLI